MRIYDLKQIMKDAWRTYKYVAKKKGKTFGEVLKSTWKMAKLQVSMKKAIDSKSQPLSGLKPAFVRIEVSLQGGQLRLVRCNGSGRLSGQPQRLPWFEILRRLIRITQSLSGHRAYPLMRR